MCDIYFLLALSFDFLHLHYSWKRKWQAHAHNLTLQRMYNQQQMEFDLNVKVRDCWKWWVVVSHCFSGHLPPGISVVEAMRIHNCKTCLPCGNFTGPATKSYNLFHLKHHFFLSQLWQGWFTGTTSLFSIVRLYHYYSGVGVPGGILLSDAASAVFPTSSIILWIQITKTISFCFVSGHSCSGWQQCAQLLNRNPPLSLWGDSTLGRKTSLLHCIIVQVIRWEGGAFPRCVTGHISMHIQCDSNFV